MGQFKDVGRADVALMEEMAEAIQVISKKIRFSGDWNEIPEGKTVSRWEELSAEMEDVFYQWDRLQKDKNAASMSQDEYEAWLEERQASNYDDNESL